MTEAMNVDAFLETAWADHGERPAEVAQRLSSSLALIESAAQIAPYARLAAHVYGEHLGRWSDGIALLQSMRSLPCYEAEAAEAALARGIAALRFAGGDGDGIETLPRDERIAVLATASSALAGRGEFKRAIDTYDDALMLARDGLPAGSPALRALAVGGNNLACALEEKPDRQGDEVRAMVAAAEGGLTYWRQAGTWYEEAIALYRLSNSLRRAGRHAEAVGSARRCIEVCADNAAAPIDRFFGHAALALAQRAAGDARGFDAARSEALELHALIAPDERSACEADLRLLGQT